MNEMSKRTLKAIPEDFPVRPLTTQAQRNTAHHPTQDGHCGLWWDDAIPTTYTPTPAARCPFEAFHTEDHKEEGLLSELSSDHPAVDAALDAYESATLEGGKNHRQSIMASLAAALPHLNTSSGKHSHTHGDQED